MQKRLDTCYLASWSLRHTKKRFDPRKAFLEFDFQFCDKPLKSIMFGVLFSLALFKAFNF